MLRTAKVDTVVHASVCPDAAGARKRDLIGTMRPLVDCQRSGHVRKLVFRSTAAVHDAGPTSPAVFTEQDGASRGQAVELERYVEGFARRRPEAAVTTVRDTIQHTLTHLATTRPSVF